MNKLRVSGLFENPEDAANFKLDTGEPAFTWNDYYPITGLLATTITDIVLKTKLGITRQMPNDEVNDGDEQQLSEGNKRQA